MTHLTAETWSQLRARTLAPAESAQLLRHLAQECEACDFLVAGLEDPVLDCCVDGALARLAEPQAERAAEPAPRYRRVEQRVLAALAPRPWHRRWAWRWMAPVAMAASLALLVLLSLDPGRPSQRLKGQARAASLTAVVSPRPGAPLEPLAAPGTYTSGAVLFFTYELPTDAHAYLGRVGVDGAVEPFYPPQGAGGSLERAGAHPLSVGGTVHGYSLEGLRGRQRFVVIGSPAPLEGAALVKALAEEAAAGASVEIEVE